MTPPPPADDLAAAQVPPIVKVAAFVLVVAGVFGVFHALQLMAILTRIEQPWALLPPAIAASSVAAIVGATGLARVRTWGPLAGLAAAFALDATSTLWMCGALLNGLFTLFGFLVPGFAMAALAFTVMAQGPCARAARARKRLEEQGLQLGV